MILNFISLLFVFLSLIGWGYIFKSIFLKNEKFYNIDLFFGIFFLSLILIFLNFFFPLKYAFFPIIFLGLIFFIKLFYKKNCKINLFYFSIIIFFFCFISAHNPVQIDADLYHMQTIKWISEYKISFGLVNLEERLGVNSLWHLFISSFNVSKNLQLIFLLNIIPLSVLFYEVSQNLIKSNFKLPHLYLYFSLTFILFFSLIHPYNNGQIFNHLGTPENDTAAMVTILLSIYIFLINLESFDKKNFYLTNVLIALSILFKLSHIYLFVLILINFYIFKKKITLINKLNFLLTLLGLFWLIRGLIISACLIFPFSKSCFFNLDWSLPERDLVVFEMISKAFNRDTPLRNKWMNFDYTIYSFDWLLPWFKTYFLETSFFYFTFVALTFSLIFYFFNKFILKVNFKNIKEISILYIVVFLVIFPAVWLQSPEIRYAYGAFITIGCLPLAINLNFKNYHQLINLSKYFFMFIPIFLILKNIENYELYNIKLNRDFTYEDIKFYDKINGYNVYASVLCKDLKEICVTFPDRDYKIEKKYGYFFFKRYGINF